MYLEVIITCDIHMCDMYIKVITWVNGGYYLELLYILLVTDVELSV